MSKFQTWEEIVEQYPDKWIIIDNKVYTEDGALLGGEIVEVCTDAVVDDVILKYRKQGKRYLHLRTTTSFNNGVQIIH